MVSKTEQRCGQTWTIVLAGGEGARMRPAIREWFGWEAPKQYCTFVGSQSMIQRTLDRASCISGAERVVTVIARGHRRFLATAAPAGVPGVIVEQPLDRGTAAGVYLALAHVLERDPRATVLLLPSDHFVHPEDRFQERLLQACALAEEREGRLVLVGARPEGGDSDYGWILPEAGEGGRVRPVAQFVEKPPREVAVRLLRQGALWSTMIVASRGATLWDLGARCIPSVLERFETLRTVLRAVRHARVPAAHAELTLHHVYGAMEPADFSRDVLGAAPPRMAHVLVAQDVEWSDWGRPERILESLARIGAPAPTAPSAALRAS
jgi:mannose-1-phosphate guanylyltransferase